jgi:hypothetical protein
MNGNTQSPNWENALLLKVSSRITPRKTYSESFPEDTKQRCNLIIANGERMQGIVWQTKNGIMWKTKYSFKYESAVAGWQITNDTPDFF